MNINAISQILENAATLNGKHQEHHEKRLLIGAGEAGGIAPDEPPKLNTLSLQADFIDKTQRTVDNITVSRDAERDTIHITIELL